MSCVVCNNKNCNCHIFHKETLDRVKNNIISDQEITTISNIFKVLSNFTRVKILEALKDEELCVCDIGSLVGITKSAVSHQMKTLKEYDLVKSRREGKMVYYQLNDNYISKIIKETNKYVEELNANNN